jgi:hypothetical protein
MKNNLLIFGTKDFNNSLDQIKEDLDFSFTYFNQNKFLNDQVSLSSAIIVDSQICENITILSTINKIINKPILLLLTKNLSVNCKYDGKNYLPINFIELKSKIINTITSYRFNKNSSIIIKNFILDKNEKKLKQDNLFITITEREVQFIELIFNEKRPLTKNIVLKKIWKYAENADTHTVETHVYRLRKKIFDKFKEKNFITNSKLGYSI